MQGSEIFMGIFFQVTVVGWCLTAFVLFRCLMRLTWQQPAPSKLLFSVLGAGLVATVALIPLWYATWFLMWTGPLGVLTPLAVLWTTALIVFIWAIIPHAF